MNPAKPKLADLKALVTAPGKRRALTQVELDRLWSRVRQDESGCWIWQGARYVCGYGKLKIDQRTAYAHRVMYMIFVGDIPPGLYMDHLCRVRECCNPAHLEPVTPRENVMRSPISTPSINASKTHCRNGHELSGHNLIITREGWRLCRTCKNANRRRSEAKKKARP